MPDYEPAPAVTDEAPWSERLTEYDDRHVETYVRLLEAANEGMAKDEIARRILGIDPDAEPARACKAVKSHMARAKWMGKVGYLLLAAGDRPGGDGRGRAGSSKSCSPSASRSRRVAARSGEDRSRWGFRARGGRREHPAGASTTTDRRPAGGWRPDTSGRIP